MASVARPAAQPIAPDAACTTALAALFAPLNPQLGTYQVCTSALPLPELVRPGWLVENVAPADAFGTAGAYDRTRLARLYGGRRATVARGHIRGPQHIESITLISPYPDPSLGGLQAGTLIMVHRVPGV